MATVLPADFGLFTDFMTHRYRNGSEPTLEEGVQAFREYQRELNDLRAKVQHARDQVARGEVGSFDEEEIIEEVRRELAEEGIVD